MTTYQILLTIFLEISWLDFNSIISKSFIIFNYLLRDVEYVEFSHKFLNVLFLFSSS